MYGWQAGGTHPTGMPSCFVRYYLLLVGGGGGADYSYFHPGLLFEGFSTLERHNLHKIFIISSLMSSKFNRSK